MLKRKLFWGLLMFLLLALAVWLLGNNQGYVLIVRAPYRIQFSFNFLLFLIVISFIGLHYLLRLIRYLKLFPKQWQQNKARKRLQESHAALISAVDAFINEDYLTAEQNMTLANRLLDDPRLNTSVAAIKQRNAQPPEN